MKNILTVLILTIIMFSWHNSYSQSIEITPSYGYQFGTKVNYGPSYLKINDSDQFGLTIGVETYNNTMAEVSYFHQGSELLIRDRIISPTEARLSDIAGDWILVGMTKYLPKGKLRPFAGGALGIVIISTSNENRDIVDNSLSNRTKFGFTFKAGLNYMISESVGLNFQGNMMFPVQWSSVYIGAGLDGASGGVSLSSTSLIGGFSAGLVFKIDN